MKRRIRQIAVILLFCMLVNLSAFPVSAKYFSDIYPGMLDREFFDAFNYVSDNGWIAGTDSTHFSPYVSISRAMFVAILYRYADTEESYSNSFTDVPANAYYYDAVGWAVHYGIVAGTSTTTFSPDATITKEQMAAFLYRYATNYDGKTYTPSTFASITAHPDYSYVSSYAIEAIRWAKTYHVFPLVNNSDYISPTANMNRAYAALHLANYAKNVTGFRYEDLFSFTNSDYWFGTTYDMSAGIATQLYEYIDDYYGDRTYTALVDKVEIMTKVNSEFKGSCFGMTICTLLDKLGKIDFNRNFGNGATNMRNIGRPQSNIDTVESAINYYQFIHSIEDFTDCYRRYSGIVIGTGVISLFAHFKTYGVLPIAYYWEENGVEYGHAVLLQNMVQNSTTSFELTLIDPNCSSPVTATMTTDGALSAVLDNKQLTTLYYYPLELLHFLDNFDLDGTYNNTSYSSNNTGLISEQSDKAIDGRIDVSADAEVVLLPNTAKLTLPCSPFKITNFSGETLTYSNGEFEGNMKVYKEIKTPNGPDAPAELSLTVDTSDYFIYENLSGSSTSFCAITSDGFGSVCGNGLQKAIVNTVNRQIDIYGVNMEYRTWLDIAQPGYEYFYLEGKNDGSFSIYATQQGVTIRGVSGVQKSGFSDINSMTAKTAQLEFMETSVFDLAHVAKTGTLIFTTIGASELSSTVSITAFKEN